MLRRRVRVPRPRLVQRVDELVVRARGRRVLHLGCTNWPYTAESDRAGTLLHRRLADAAGELWGLDGDGDGLAALRALGFDHLWQGDLEDLAAAEPLGGRATDETAGEPFGPFDVVVAGEVLEHLGRPAALLEGLRPLVAPGGEVLVTVPNAYCAFRFASYAASGWRGHGEPVHPDHVAYYSASTLTVLLERHRYEVLDLSFYDLGREHRPTAPRSWRVVNDAAVRLAPQLADGLVARCRPRPA